MKPFEYAEARTEAEAIALLAEKPGSAEVLAGGSDLIGLMKQMVISPQRVVNIKEVESFRQMGPDPDGSVRIGAAVTLDEVLDHPYLDNYPSIKQAIRGINSMQLQCQGTIGGEICQRPQCWYFRNGAGLLAAEGRTVGRGDNRYHAILGNTGPAKFVSSSRIAPALIAMGAKLRIAGPTADDEALLPVEQFFRTPRHDGQRETVLEPGQVVTHIILPPVDDRRSATYEVRQGCGPEFPLAAAAVTLRFDGNVVSEAKIVLGQVAPTPWVSREASAALVGLPVDPSTAEEAGRAAVSRATPLADNGYKVQLAKVAVKRAILLAAGLDTGGF